MGLILILKNVKKECKGGFGLLLRTRVTDLG